MTFAEQLEAILACGTAVQWAEQKGTLEAAWRDCEEVEWAIWLLGELDCFLVEELSTLIEALQKRAELPVEVLEDLQWHLECRSYACNIIRAHVSCAKLQEALDRATRKENPGRG